MENLANTIQTEVENDWETAKAEVTTFTNATEEAAYNGDKDYFENLAHGGEIPVYPDEGTVPPQVCANSMHDSVQTYWDLLYAMVALAMLTILLPYLFSCCSKRIRFRVASFIYNISGLVKLICGLLLCTALVPHCPVECGQFFCSLQQYNPGPLYGVIVIFVGVLWLVKGCTLGLASSRAARSEVSCKNDGLYETAALTSAESDEEEGIHYQEAYSDTPENEDNTAQLEEPKLI